MLRRLAGGGIVMTIHRLGALAFALCALMLLSFCGSSSTSSSGTPPASAFVLDPSSAGSAVVTPEAGGVVRTANGHTLTVPPGAVTDAVTITLTPLVFPTNGRIDVFGGVVATPARIDFLVPATLTLALAQPLEPGLELELAESHDPGTPASFGPANELFIVDADGTTATGIVQGFTGKIVEKNCHSGTRDNLLAAWNGRPGRDSASVARTTGLTSEQMTSCQLGRDPIQTMIAPYFAQCADTDTLPENKFDNATLDKIALTLAAGRQVVFFFGDGMALDPATGFRGAVDHSAIAVANSDGSITIRNQINLTNTLTITQLELAGKSSTLDLPLADIDKPNGMRDLHKGETTAILKNDAEYDRNKYPKCWPHVIVMCETAAEPEAGVPDAAAPDAAGLAVRIKVITTISDDPNETIAAPLSNLDVMIGSSTVHIPADGDVGRTTVSSGVPQIVKVPKSQLDDAAGNHVYRVGSVNVHVTKEAGSGKRCAPLSQEGDLPVTFSASASNPSAQSEYEVGIRIVPFLAPQLASPDLCN
jgi:hypothetical protein